MRDRKGQFIKGQSGNPAGRPRRHYEFLEILDDELERKKNKITRKKEICRTLVNAAIKDDVRAAIKILEIYERRHESDLKYDIIERLERLEDIVNADQIKTA